LYLPVCNYDYYTTSTKAWSPNSVSQ
jgi:hypothetical protein